MGSFRKVERISNQKDKDSMNDEYNPSDPIPGAELDVPASEGVENDSQPVAFKDTIKAVTGREYADDEAALKAVQETFKHVGQAGQKVKSLEKEIENLKTQVVTPEINSKVEKLERQLQQTQFYAEHPEYNNPDFKALIEDMGGNPEEVVQKDSFKKAYEALKVSAEKEKSKSVLASNPRLGQVTDKISQAKEALSKGDQSSTQASAVEAVIGAFNLGE